MENKDVVPVQGWKNHFSRESLRRFIRNLSNRQVVVVLLLLVIGTSLTLGTDTFLTFNNISNLLRNSSWIAIASFGESMVIISGGIDLSVGATMALAGIVAAKCMGNGMPVFLAIAVGLSTGMIVGWVNGSIIARSRLPAFIVTLGTMSITRGITVGLTGGWPVRELPEAFRMLGQNDIRLGAFSIPILVFIVLGIGLLFNLLLTRTIAGRYIYTLSNSERALLVTGVDVINIKVLVYTLCAVLSAAGGMLMAARLGVAAPTAATSYELDIIAAAVIGGASLYGGVGSIPGVFLGTIVMQMLRNGLVLLGIAAHWQTVTIGTVILAAISLDYIRQRQ